MRDALAAGEGPSTSPRASRGSTALAKVLCHVAPRAIRADPLHILRHFATGYLPDFLNQRDGDVGWVRWSHRGVQFLDRIVIPRKQRPYVLTSRFELKFNQAFKAVLQGCADASRDAIQKRAGQTWMTRPLIEGLLKLREMGYAHSFETWQDGRLVGGIWGVQLGGLVTMSSMFSSVSNAGRFAMGRTMLHLRERSFELVDMGMVPDHHVHFGAQWIPRWMFESMLPRLIGQRISIDDAHPCRPIPWRIRMHVPAVRIARSISRRVGIASFA